MAAEGIPVNQPYPTSEDPKGAAYYQNPPPPAAGQGQWSTGLCECFSDVPHCCMTCWCPCITFGQIAEIVDRGQSSCGTSGALYALIMALTGCHWIYSCSYRTKMKMQYGMEADSCADCCVHFWCEPCALCQESRELQRRGYDLALGWQGNMEKQGQGMSMAAPAAPGGMMR